MKLEKVPALQIKHALILVAATVEDHRPPVHKVQVDACEAELTADHVPALQLRHCAKLEAPTTDDQ